MLILLLLLLLLLMLILLLLLLLLLFLRRLVGDDGAAVDERGLGGAGRGWEVGGRGHGPLTRPRGHRGAVERDGGNTVEVTRVLAICNTQTGKWGIKRRSAGYVLTTCSHTINDPGAVCKACAKRGSRGYLQHRYTQRVSQ